MELRDPESTKKLFEKYNPTHVIHLAALGRCSSLFASYNLWRCSGRALQEHEVQGRVC